MAAFLNSPHPLVTTATLYLAEPPGRLKWKQVVDVFKPCGVVQSGGRSHTLGGRRRWVVHFEDTFHAEMALATLQNAPVPGVNPPWNLPLSASPELASALPQERLFPQFVKSDLTPHPILHYASPQRLFEIFRNAGPLVSLRKGVNIGHPERAIVLEYWYEEHAQYARNQQQALHALTQHSPPFVLRTFDPLRLHCTNLDPSIRSNDLKALFTEFGILKDAQVPKAGTQASPSFVSFFDRDTALSALQAMHGKFVRTKEIVVQFHELKAQDVFRLWSTKTKENISMGTAGPNFATNTHNATEDQEGANDRRKEEQRKTEQQAKDAVAREVERLRREHRFEKRRRREEAQRAEQLARKKREDADKDAEEAMRLHALANEALSSAEIEAVAASKACVEAKQAWLAAMDRQARAWTDVDQARTDKDETLQKMQSAETNRIIAEQEEAVSRGEKEKAEREAREAGVDKEDEQRRKSEEEEQRQAELQESIRRMQELHRIEEADRLAKEKAREEDAKRRKEEAARLERERIEREKAEAERKVREQREREERERREVQRRQQEYVRASAAERLRCQTRDKAINYAFWFNWYQGIALRRFISVSTEFDEIKFREAQPLTFESVPWPILIPPHRARLADIDWAAVEGFFAMMEKHTRNPAEYKSLVEKTHRRFHPDKWRARGLLKTVLDENLRADLEEKGNIVAQALTPIWLKSKEMS